MNLRMPLDADSAKIFPALKSFDYSIDSLADDCQSLSRFPDRLVMTAVHGNLFGAKDLVQKGVTD